MHKGYEYAQEVKQIFFNIIKFAEEEKLGPVIPLFNVNERLSFMLGISMRSVGRLKSEMMGTKRKMDEEKQEKEIQKLQAIRQLRNLRSRSSSSSSSSSTSTTTMAATLPIPNPPSKRTNSGLQPIMLTE
jgi:hypothetical protein